MTAWLALAASGYAAVGCLVAVFFAVNGRGLSSRYGPHPDPLRTLLTCVAFWPLVAIVVALLFYKDWRRRW